MIVLAAAALISNAHSAEITYDFSGGSSDTNKMGFWAQDSWPPINTPDIASQFAMPAEAYSLMASSDGVHFVSTATQNNAYAIHHFKFIIEQDTDTIDGIYVEWVGRGVDGASSNHYCQLRLWDYEFGDSNPALAYDYGATREVTLSSAIGGNYLRYIDTTTKRLDVFVVGGQESTGNPAAIWTNYIKLVISTQGGGESVPTGTFIGNFNETGGAIYDNGANDEAFAVVVDTFSIGAPFIYVVGVSSNGTEGNNWLVVKYDGTGNKVAAVGFNYGSDDQAKGAVLDNSGNLYVTGYRGDINSHDYLTMKYDSNLNLISSATYSRGIDDKAVALAINSAGNVIVGGVSHNGTTYDYLTINYNSSLAMVSSATYNSNSSDYLTGVAVDSVNNIYVTGFHLNATDDYYTIKYNSDLSSILATYTYDPFNNPARARAIHIDSNDNVFIAGDVSNGTTYDFSTIKLPSDLSSIMSTATYNSGGDDYARALDIDSQGNLVVSGQINSGGTKLFAVHYNNSLVVQSSFTYFGGSWDLGNGVAFGTSTYVYVASASDNFSNMDFKTIRRELAPIDTPPGVGITKPTATYVNSLSQIEGTAADDVGVSTVTVKIQRLSDELYWMGAGWGAEYWHGVNELWTSSWTYTSLPTFVSGSSYTIVAKAMDTSGNWSTVYATATFTYDITEPTSAVTFPVEGGQYPEVDYIQGTAYDEGVGIDLVEVSIRRNSDNSYWDGSSYDWVTGEQYNSAAGTSTWSYNAAAVRHSGGSYTVTSRAKDNAGNWEVTVSSVTYHIISSTGDWVAVSADGSYTLTVKQDGTLWSWGINEYGQLGLGDSGVGTERITPTQVGTETDWVSTYAGYFHAMAIKQDGTLWSWGRNDYGQLGLGDTVAKSTPTQVGAETDWVSVSCGYEYTLAIKQSGNLWSWGRNEYGQLGQGDSGVGTERITPTQVWPETNWVSISAGTGHSLVVKQDGTLWAWGANEHSQLGLGDQVDKSTPTQVGEETDWIVVSGGDRHTLAIKQNGTLWAWGDNTAEGKLGLGDTENRDAPTWVGSDTDWFFVSACAAHTLAVKQSGTLWSWGRNTYGQLGLGDTASKNTPTQVGEATNWASVSGGHFHSLAVRQDGTLWSWGINSYGQLGLGDKTQRWIPTQLYFSIPSEPTEFSGAAVSAGSIKWSWVDNADNESGYRVIGGTVNISGYLSPGTTSYTETGLSVNASYYRNAEAYNSGGSSSSAASAVWTLANPPANTQITAVSSHSVILSWDANDNLAYTRWGVLRSIDDFVTSTTTLTNFNSNWTSTSYTDSALDVGTTYWYKVQAFNENEIATAFDTTVPAVPRPTFDFVIRTDAASQNFAFRVYDAVDFEVVDWGTGTSSAPVTGADVLRSYTYATAGDYTIKVKGQASRISFYGNAGDGTPARLRDILTPVSDGVTGSTSAYQMFRGATNISTFTAGNFFDVASSSVTNMEEMFYGASSFNQNISGWDVSKVTNMNFMFTNATAFNQPIGNWNVGAVTNMYYLFYNANAFNQPIGSWNVGAVTDMYGMFYGASSFNQNISGWDVSKVTNMATMFRDATTFNQNISTWNVSAVTSMSGMFREASAFNQDISSWTVNAVMYMNEMFWNASSFNQDISAWDVSGVVHMYGMFYNTSTSAFDQDISTWNVSNVTDFSGFLFGVALSTSNYNALLTKWSELPLKSAVTFGGGNSTYDLGLPSESRAHIISSFTWTITDGGNSGHWEETPSGLAGVVLSTESVRWDWNMTAGATYYQFFSNPGGVLLKNIEGKGTTTWLETGLTPNWTPSRYVKAGAEGVLSSSSIIAISSYTYANPPAGTFVSAVSSYSVTVQWSDNGNPAYTRWGILKSTNNFVSSTTTLKQFTDNFTGTSYTDSGLTAATTYWYKVQAFNENAIASAFDTTVSTVPPPPPPTFDFVIRTVAGGENFAFRVYGADNFEVVDWGTGTSSAAVTGANILLSYTYANAGDYTIKVRGGASRISFYDGTPTRLRDILTPVSPAVTGITSAQEMFRGATNISTFTAGNFFDVASSSVTDMSWMFQGASAFNQDISTWDVSSVTSMQSMFDEAGVFNQDISGWNVSAVTNMSSMFSSAWAFNQDISSWNVSNVTTMLSMFYGTSVFNQPIGNWNVGNVTNMSLMFFGASVFNQAIGNWTVNAVTNMSNMFMYADGFNQNISSWNVSNVTNFTDFLFNVTLSTANYNALLTKWSKLPLKSAVTFHGGNSKYDLGIPSERRQNIISSFTWTITDGGNSGHWEETPSGLAGVALSTSSISWDWNMTSGATHYYVYSSTGGAFLKDIVGKGTTSWIETGLMLNTTYSRYVLAGAEGILSAQSNTAISSYTYANPPTGTFVSAVSSGSITVNWTSIGNPAYTRWGVLRSTDNFATSTTTLTNFDSNWTSTSYTEGSLDVGTIYWYKVRAFNENEIATAFDTTISTMTLPPPAAPSGVAGEAQSATSIKWSWNDVATEDGYRVKTDTGALLAELTANATFWLESGLSSNTSYQRYVEAYNASGSSASAVASKYTLANSHSGLWFTGVTGSSMTFTWSPNNPSYTRWGIYRSTDGFSTSTETLKDFGDAYKDTSYTDETVSNLTEYWYKVCAFNEEGIASSFNNVISTTTLDDTPPTVGITIPLDAAYYNDITQLEGTSEDNGAVSDVQISIQASPPTGQYWDGATFALSSPTWITASSVYVSSWTYSDTPFPAWVDGSSYTVVAKAVDDSGNWTTVYTTSTFIYDVGAPTSAVSFPVENGQYVNVTSISGTAIDISGISEVKTRLQRNSDSLYWNGSSWTTSLWIAASGTTTWNYDTTSISWATGTYTAWSTASDNAQPFPNWEIATSSRTFEIVFSTPAAPSGFAGAAVSTDSINWSWNDVGTEEGYRLMTGTGGLVAELDADTIFYVETDLAVNVQYTRYVEAYNVSGSSASLPSFVYTLAAVPDQPSFSAVHYTSATISWPLSNPEGTEYSAECSTASDFSVSESSSGWITSISWSAETLSDDTTYYFRVKARNSDSYETDFSLAASTVTLYIDIVPPTVGITTPADGSYQGSNLTQIQGTSADDVAVSTAAIRIYNQTSSVYWTGSMWDGIAPESAWFAPSLSEGGTFWWYNSPTLFDSKVYEINAKARDTVGNWSVILATAVFTYDITAPVSGVTSPANGLNLATLTSIGGTASDATSGVSQVQVQITDLTHGATYWNGGGWVETPAWLNVSGTNSWSYAFMDGDWTEGHIYRIQSQATDAAGNIESAVNSSTFTFSKTGVKLQVLLPGETATPGLAPGKSGTPSEQTAGGVFTVTVNAVDDLWNVAVNSMATADLTTADPNATANLIEIMGGTMLFDVAMMTAGAATITASDPDATPLISDISAEVTVNPAAPSKLQVIAPGETASPGSVEGKTGTPDMQNAGDLFTVVVNACDAYWNLISTNPTVNVTTDDPMDTDPGNVILTAGSINIDVTLVSPSAGTSITASAAGYTDGAAYVAVSSTDTVPPTVGITAPSSPYLKALPAIEGTSADNVAVSSVTLFIEREDTLVWSGSDWGAAAVWLDADNLYVSSWSYTTAITLSDGLSYSIFAKAKDSNDNWSTVYATATFTYDVSLPTSGVSYPIESGQYLSVAEITGTAEDAVSGVNAVWLELRRNADTYFWAGSSWTAVQTALLTSGTSWWTYDTSAVVWTAGYYSIYSAAGDKADNIEVTGAPVTFEILLSTPSAPASFYGAAQSVSSIQWNWTDVLDEDGYRLKSSTGGVVVELAADTTFYTETGLGVNTSYYRYVEAYNASGASSSGGAAVYTLADTPGAPSAWAVTSSTVSLQWGYNGNPPWTRFGLAKSTDNFASDSVTLLAYEDNYQANDFEALNLAPGTTYWFKTWAYNGDALQSAYSAVYSTMTIFVPPPAGPSGFAASAISTSSIVWRWTDNSDNESGFRIMTSTAGIIADLPADTTYWQESSLDINANYYRFVEAYNVGGSSGSAGFSRYTLSNPPTETYVSSVSSVSVLLAWSPNANPSYTSWGIMLSTDNFASSSVPLKDYSDVWTDTSYEAFGLAPGSTYWFRVQAFNVEAFSTAFDNIIATRTIAVEVAVSTPSAPTVFSGTAESPSSIMWSWVDNSSDEDGFYLKNSSDVVLQTLSANTTFYLETGLAVNAQVYRYAAAYNDAGESDSAPAAVYTQANPPSVFTVTASSSSVMLEWSANGNPDGTEYEIEWSTASDFSVTGYDTTTDISYQIMSLFSETTYYIRACALNGDGYSTAYYETSAYTAEPDIIPPSAVSAFTAETVNMKGAVKLSWTNPGDDGTIGTIYGGAQMIRYITGASATTLPDIVKDISPGTTDTLTITGLVPGGAYTFYIKVKDASGNISEEVSASASAGAQPALAVSGITSPITAGVSSNFTVTAKNSLGETDTGYVGAITFESRIMGGLYDGTNAMVSLPADYSFTSADEGNRVFEAAFLDKGELYNCYVRATDKSDALITGQQVVAVSPLDFISGLVTQKNGTPVTGVYVEAYGIGLSTGIPFTTVNGSYTIIGLDVGTYTVRATWTGADGLESSAEKQTINGKASFNFTLGVNFDLVVVQGSVSGVSASAIRSSSGLIMPQSVSDRAFVEIQAGKRVMRISLNDDGSFRLGNLLPGRYSVRAWDGSRYSNSETLQLSGGAQATVSFTFPVSAEVYCWPNPFVELKTSEPGVHIVYMGSSYNAELKIYTLTGELVREARDFSFLPRSDSQGYQFVWDLRNNSRQDVASGVYFYTLDLTDPVSGERKQYKGKIGVVR